jgi:Mpv17 / PMP22 family
MRTNINGNTIRKMVGYYSYPSPLNAQRQTVLRFSAPNPRFTSFVTRVTKSFRMLFHRSRDWYEAKLASRPVLTKSISSGVIAGCGDILCQLFVEQRDVQRTSAASTEHSGRTHAATSVNSFNETDSTDQSLPLWNVARTGRFVLLGTVLVGPTIHYWYTFLGARLFPGMDRGSILKRVALDQLIFSPAFLAVWLAALWRLEGFKVPNARSVDTQQSLSPQMEESVGRTASNCSITTIARIRTSLEELMPLNWMIWTPVQIVNFRFVPLAYQVLFSNVVAVLWNIILSYSTNRKTESPTRRIDEGDKNKH